MERASFFTFLFFFFEKCSRAVSNSPLVILFFLSWIMPQIASSSLFVVAVFCFLFILFLEGISKDVTLSELKRLSLPPSRSFSTSRHGSSPFFSIPFFVLYMASLLTRSFSPFSHSLRVLALFSPEFFLFKSLSLSISHPSSLAVVRATSWRNRAESSVVQSLWKKREGGNKE